MFKSEPLTACIVLFNCFIPWNKYNHSCCFKHEAPSVRRFSPRIMLILFHIKSHTDRLFFLHGVSSTSSWNTDLCRRIIQTLTPKQIFIISADIFLSAPSRPAERLMMNERVVGCSCLSVSFIWVIKSMCVSCVKLISITAESLQGGQAFTLLHEVLSSSHT